MGVGSLNTESCSTKLPQSALSHLFALAQNRCSYREILHANRNHLSRLREKASSGGRARWQAGTVPNVQRDLLSPSKKYQPISPLWRAVIRKAACERTLANANA